MKYLLDTHILLWALSSPQKLSPQVRRILECRGNTVFVSTGSLWEIIIKKSLGKLHAPKNLLEYIQKQDFEILDILPEHIFTIEKLPLLHKDPFDRLLIAQAQRERFTLITDDSKIQKYDNVVLLEV